MSFMKVSALTHARPSNEKGSATAAKRRVDCNREGPAPFAGARGCVKSHCDGQNRSKKTVETLSRKIKTSYWSSSCVGFFALGLIIQPRAWLGECTITVVAEWIDQDLAGLRLERNDHLARARGTSEKFEWFL